MSSGERLHVFVLIDALGWSYIAERPFLDEQLPHRQPLPTVLGYSSGAIPTLLTGKLPSEHGQWNLFYYDPAGSPFRWLRRLLFLPAPLLENRLSRRLLTELGRRVLGLGPLFDCCVSPRLLPWFNFVEKGNIYDTGGIPGTPSIFDQLAQSGVPHRVYSYHRFSDAEILEQARREVETGSARVFFLYLSQIDAFLHKQCHDPAAISNRLADYARGLTAVFEAARRRDASARFSIFSDHGMTPVEHHHDLGAALSSLGLRMPEDYLAVYDSTMARFWFFDETARQRVRERLEQQQCGRILEDAELERLGIRFPDRRYGELVFLLQPGWLISSSGFNTGGWMPRGMHGYDPADAYSDGVFLSSEPPSTPIRGLVDVHAHLRQCLG